MVSSLPLLLAATSSGFLLPQLESVSPLQSVVRLAALQAAVDVLPPCTIGLQCKVNCPTGGQRCTVVHSLSSVSVPLRAL